MVNRDDYTFATNIQTKIHRAQQNLEFMNNCQNSKLLPNFTKLSRSVITQGRLSPQQITQIRHKKLTEAIHREQDRLTKNEIKLNNFLLSIKNQFNSNIIYERFKFKLCTIISKIEQHNDLNRVEKFKKLQPRTHHDYAKINITNISECDIPNEVLNCLELGLQIPVGGKQNELETLTELDRFFEKWKSFAKDQNIPAKTIFEVRARLYIAFGDLNKCVSNDHKRKILIKFFKQNDHLIVANCDKTKHLIIMTKTQYIEKLKTTFSDQTKFENLKKNPLKNDIDQFHKLLKKIEPYVHPKTFLKMKPNEAIKRSYGLIKTQKQNWPMRPIVSSLNSVTSGAEDFLLKLITPIVEQCESSTKSTKDFKSHFQNFQKNFNSETMEVISWDAKSLFTNVCTKTVVDHIIKEIYKNPDLFFKEKIINETTKREKKLKIPKKILKNFLMEILTKFSSFSSLAGYHRQINGIAMGSKLSPGLANIYCSLMEKMVIKQHQINGNILFYLNGM